MNNSAGSNEMIARTVENRTINVEPPSLTKVMTTTTAIATNPAAPFPHPTALEMYRPVQVVVNVDVTVQWCSMYMYGAVFSGGRTVVAMYTASTRDNATVITVAHDAV